MSLYQPRYISLEEVKLELKNKITFSNTNREFMSDNEVLDNIQEAEAAVEYEFSRQYITPFVGVNDETFYQIQQISTIKIIQKMCLLETCLFIMETKFGKSEGVRGQGFLEQYQKRYDRQLYDILGKDPKSGQWLYPPLPGLKLDPNSAFFQKGIPFPRVATVGGWANSLTNAVLRRTTNPIKNWWVGVTNGRRRF